MNNQSLAELIVKLERDCEKAQEANVLSSTSAVSGLAGMGLILVILTKLNVYFNRRYAEYAITVIGNSGVLDSRDEFGSVVLLVGHMVVTSDLPDIFKRLHDQAPPHLK